MWKRLDRWQANFDSGWTREKYLNLCEQMGSEPVEEKIPPELGDFPLPLQQAIEVFNRLGDRVVADIGFLGKDYTALPVHMEAIGVVEKELFLETLVRLDASMIKRSQEQMKQARDKLNRKGK